MSQESLTNMIEFASIQQILDEAGIEAVDIQSMEIRPGGVEFTLYVRMPVEEGKEGPGSLLLHQDAPMLVKRMVSIHRPEDHVHEPGVDSDHVHD